VKLLIIEHKNQKDEVCFVNKFLDLEKTMNVHVENIKELDTNE
jgi:hypothetical protein